MAKSLIHESLCKDPAVVDILDAASIAMFFCDATGIVKAASRRLKDFFDVEPSEVVGQPISVVAERLGKCFAEFVTYHEVVGYPLHDQEHEFIRDTELVAPQRRFLQISSSPVKSRGVFVGRLWLMHDVTADRDITELKIQYGGARGADELKSKFLTVVSHQMRTPLNAVRWNMELLLSGSYPSIQGEAKETLQDAYRAIVNGISIVDDMMFAVDIEQRALRLDRAEADLGDVLAKAVHDSARSAELKCVALKFVPVPPGLPKLFLDADKIGKVFARLIDNAIKYTPAGGSIQVTVRGDGTHVAVAVRDTGIGIPDKDKPRIFERFFRSAQAIALNPDASGLGLYIVRFIVAAHDGTIRFDSTEGQGTTFTVTLPKRVSAH
jgi:signal transduction histidine kinase